MLLCILNLAIHSFIEWLNKINVGSLQDLALQKKRCLETLLYVNEVENILQVKHR